MRTSLQSHLPIDCTGDRKRKGMLAVTGRMCRCAIAVGISLIVIPGSTVSVSQAFISQSAIIQAAIIQAAISQTPDDEAPHRLLPLPDGKNADASAQAMLLRQLQGIMRQQPGERPPQVSPGSSSQPDNANPEPKPGHPSPISLDQLKGLQETLQRQFGGQLPPGLFPPNIDAQQRQQVENALKDPQRQQQLRQMLEQFANDGTLPTPPHSSDAAPPLPIPPQLQGQSRQPRSPQTQSGAANPDSFPDRTTTNRFPPPTSGSPQSGETPQPEIEDDSEANKTPDGRPAESSRERDSSGFWQSLGFGPKGDSKENPAQDDNPPTHQQANPPTNSRKTSGNEKPSPTVPDPSGRIPSGPQLGGSDSENSSNLNRLPNESSSAAARNDSTSPSQAPSPGGSSMGPRNPLAGMDPNQLRAMQEAVRQWLDQTQSQDAPSNANSLSGGNAIDTLNERSRFRPGSAGMVPDANALEQARRQLEAIQRSMSQNPRPQNPDSNSIANGTRSSSAPDVRPAERLPSGTKTSPDGRSGSESVKSQTRRESADPGIDIRQELERRGLRGTFEKLVEQARKEANAQKQAEQEARRAMSNNPNSQDQNSGNTSASAGGSATTSDNIRNNDSVERSLLRTLDGLRDDVVEIAKELQEESRQQNPRSSADTGQPGSRQSPHWRPDIKNRSPEISQQRNSGGGPQNGPAKSETLRSIRDGASEFLSDLASGPDAKMPSAPDSASSLESLADAGSSFISIIVPILVIGALLAALLALAAKQTGMWPDAQTETIRASAIRSGTIRTRRDVVTAFHQLTGRTINPSLPSIEDWRTHREAAEQLTMMSPSLNNAVQVLADIYEQARYLPDDYNLTDDQIRDVRDALALCERGANR